jgi:hypothetical protein
MAASKFIAVGENIHCTRIFKVGGEFVKSLDDDTHVIAYREGGREKHLPIPRMFVDSSDWQSGRVKHAAVAIWQGLNGDAEGKAAGIEYLKYLARHQEAHGASFLDLNVDEYSTDLEERLGVAKWLAGIIQEAASIPLSIDSSNLQILDAGLSACNQSKGKPMVNSVSLERKDAIRLAANAGAAVIAAASGETSMPTSQEERLENLDKLMDLLQQAGLGLGDIYLDPLVFPVSVDPNNGILILKTIEALRKRYGSDIHFAPGLSNISYGMPKRKLINQVFAHLCTQRGLDGGIVDPIQINDRVLAEIDPSSEEYKLTRAFLIGEDQFGMSYISAVRGGRI